MLRVEMRLLRNLQYNFNSGSHFILISNRKWVLWFAIQVRFIYLFILQLKNRFEAVERANEGNQQCLHGFVRFHIHHSQNHRSVNN